MCICMCVGACVLERARARARVCVCVCVCVRVSSFRCLDSRFAHFSPAVWLCRLLRIQNNEFTGVIPESFEDLLKLEYDDFNSMRHETSLINTTVNAVC